MVGYIYRITCIPTGKCYVGITKNYKQRTKKHIVELNNGTHHSPKLLNAWRYYGEQNFEWTCREVEVDCYDDLYAYEIEEIKKYNSYEDGYNCNSGGKISDWCQHVKNEDVVVFLCVLEYAGDGYGKAFEEKFGWAKGTASSIKRKERYFDAQISFEKMSKEEKEKIATDFLNNSDIVQIVKKRQLTQGGCEKAYSLKREDFFFAFCAQEMGYGYTPVALFLEIKPATVKDWFNGRSRKKEKELYTKLSTEEKSVYEKKVLSSHLEAIGTDKLLNKKEEDVISFFCYDQKYPQNDMAIQRLFGWSEGTCYGMRQENRYPIAKAKVKLLTEAERDKIANELNNRLQGGHA